MCGIAGLFLLNGRAVSAEQLGRMADVLVHRGPDDRGFAAIDPSNGRVRTFDEPAAVRADELEGMRVGFAHQRLSIIDLTSAGHQPMSTDDGSRWLIYNGEIYNHVELRDELAARGYRFRSRTDTEVILHAYDAWGLDCVTRFNGMWAFVLWDQRSQRLVASRDRFGVKPLYYAWDGQTFVFGSEIKALLASGMVERRPNNRTIYRYLSAGFGYLDTTDDTFFGGIRKVPAATNMVLERGTLRTETYWALQPRETDPAKLVSSFAQLLEDAIRIRLRSDVPVGGSLSGGLDSSSVTSVAAALLGAERYRTFTAVCEDPRHDERAFSRAVARATGVPNHEVQPSTDGFVDVISRILWHQDEPFPDLNIYSQWSLYGAVREQGVKVFLNGHGGDELLGGYPHHQLAWLAALARSGKWLRLGRELRRYATLTGSDDGALMRNVLRRVVSRVVPDAWRRRVAAQRPPVYVSASFARAHAADARPGRRRFGDPFKDELWAGFAEAPLPAWLHLEDRNSMAFSIESREPLLDYRLVELLFGAPTDRFVRDGFSKWILREAMAGVLPEEVRLRTDKRAFQSDAEVWFRGPLKPLCLELFTSESFRRRGYWNVPGVLAAYDSHCRGERNYRFAIWAWMCLELWFRTMIDRPAHERAFVEA